MRKIFTEQRRPALMFVAFLVLCALMLWIRFMSKLVQMY